MTDIPVPDPADVVALALWEDVQGARLVFETIRTEESLAHLRAHLAGRRMLEAGFTPASHRLRCYVLIGFPKDTFDAAEERLRAVTSIGMTPMAMLWRPDTVAAKRHAPGPDWRQFQRRWARPAIIHGRGNHDC